MSDMYRYARSRLLGAQPERQVFLGLFTKRVIRSMSRVTATRIHNNKWLVLISALRATVENTDFIEEIKAIAAKNAKRTPLGSRRLQFMLDVLMVEHSSTASQRSMLELHMNAFKDADDKEFFQAIAVRMGFNQADCGHLTAETQWLMGDQESHMTRRSACPYCAQASVVSGERTFSTWNNGSYILTEYLVSARYSDRLVDVDRRNPDFTFDERRQFWRHRNWTPYTNLVGDYHSSQRRGFNLIKSPWFTANRRAFGCELEVQVQTGNVNEAAGRVHDALNPSGEVGEYCSFERDGSIGTGFEMVTQPAGLDVHAEKFAKFLQDREMKRGMRSHEGGSCGFHVHVGREFLTQSQIFRMQSFINDVRNEGLIKKIARRYNSGYSRFKPELSKFTSQNKMSSDRYEALNVSNSKTVEFRIFRGSLRYESIMAALEFVNAVCMFCTPGVVSILEFNAVGFKKFIMRPDNRADTKYLRSYLSLDASTDQEQQPLAA